MLIIGIVLYVLVAAGFSMLHIAGLRMEGDYRWRVSVLLGICWLGVLMIASVFLLGRWILDLAELFATR